MTGLLVWSIADIWHQGDSLELSPDTGVDTLGPAPVGLSHEKQSQLATQWPKLSIIWTKVTETKPSSKHLPSPKLNQRDKYWGIDSWNLLTPCIYVVLLDPSYHEAL